MIKINSEGTFKKSYLYYEKLLGVFDKNPLVKYGEMGVQALKENTPVDSGKTANSWVYEIKRTDHSASITWSNTNIVDGWACVAILLQYGHATGTGGYVVGVDYINPAMKPIFEEMAEKMWKEIKSL